MKTLCITGSVPSQLTAAAHTLCQAGLQDPKPLPAADVADLHDWHRRLLATSPHWPPQAATFAQPGKLWERLAADLFLANIDQPLWGWADTNSLWLLDFWQAFEPQLHFLLLGTAPNQLLTEALTHSDLPTDPERLMAAWTLGQEQMLRFHLRHPQQSLLLDAEAARSNPAWLVDCCIQHWDWPLKPNAKPSFEPAPACAMPPAEPVASALADLLGATSAPAQSLLHEIAATWQTDAPNDEPRAPADDTPPPLIPAYRRLVEDAAERQRQIEHLQAELTEVRERQLAQANERQAEIEAQLRDSSEENELLLLQLHQVQEELEQYFLKHQDAQQTLDAQDARWQRLFARHPDLYDYARLALKPTPDRADATTAPSPQLHWEIEDLISAAHRWPTLSGHADIHNGQARLHLNPTDNAPDATPHWLDPDTLSSAADWALLQILPGLLAQALADPSQHPGPDAISTTHWIDALHATQQALSQTPPRLRFDRVELEREQVNPDYEHLWLRLAPVVFATQGWPEWSFRLSTAIPDPAHFGTHPKLEFPAPQSPLDSWHPESQDDFGPKLELRFALPQSMDAAIWNSLNTADQHLITALIARLPDILNQLQAEHPALERPWADWHRLASDIQRIHAHQGAPQ